MLKNASKSLFFFALVCLLLVVIFYRQTPEIENNYALHPKQFHLFYTAFTAIWLHANLEHLFGNLISLISLSVIFLLLFPNKWFSFFLKQYFVSSVLFFFIAKENTLHRGASVWVYAFVAFILTILLIQPNKKLLSIFFLTVLFFGSVWWGLLPIMPHVSYEGHLSGAIAGIVVAIVNRNEYLKILPQNRLPDWFKNETTEEINPYDKI